MNPCEKPGQGNEPHGRGFHFVCARCGKGHTRLVHVIQCYETDHWYDEYVSWYERRKAEILELETERENDNGII